jgi:predicted metal-dependent phosphoesterase TrpH
MPDAAMRGPQFKESLEYKTADLHLHSNYSYDVVNLSALSPRSLYEKAVESGMGFFTLTDHDTILGIQALEREIARDYGSEAPIPLIPGIEYTIRDDGIGHTIHVNVLGLDLQQMLELARRRKSLASFLAFCRSEDLYHAYNHPFWFQRGEHGNPRAVRGLIPEFPVIELNAGRIGQLNHRTHRIAMECGRVVVATSDSHTGFVGKGYSAAPGRTPAEFLRNVREGVSYAVPHHLNLPDFVQEICQLTDMVFTGRPRDFKLKRTLFRGMPVVRLMTNAALGTQRRMPSESMRALVRHLVRMLVYPPAYAFVRGQARMERRILQIGR